MLVIGEKGRGLTQSYHQNSYTYRQFQKAKWQHKNAIKTFDYTMIVDWLRKVSLGNDSNQTGVVAWRRKKQNIIKLMYNEIIFVI